MKTRLFRSGSVLVRISLVPYKYVPQYMCIVRGTYFLRTHIYAQQLKSTCYENSCSLIKSLYCLSLSWTLGCLLASRG